MAIEGFTPYKLKDAEVYSRYRWWLGLTWGDLLDRASDIYPKKIGVVDDRTRVSFGGMRRTVDKLSVSLIELGIETGDRVLLQVPNWAEYLYCFYALQKIGAIPVLLLPRHTDLEINHLGELTRPRAWILPRIYKRTEYDAIIDRVLKRNPWIKHVILVREKDRTKGLCLDDLVAQGALTESNLAALALRRPDPMEVAQIMPTGGTTGLPKAAPRTHNDFLCTIEYHSKAWEITSEDTVLTVAPISHGQGMFCGVGGTIINYAKLVLLDSTDPDDMCKAIERERVTALPTVPALVIRLVNYEGRNKYDLRSLKKIYAGGAPSTAELVRSVKEKIGCAFVNAFGSVEGTNAMTRLDDDFEVTCRTVGRKCCPYEVYKIIDRNGKELPPNHEGELVSKGPGIFTGYFKSEGDRENIFTTDGFLKTGDLARIDEEGNITITGRIKDIILRGGENICTNEIENLINDHQEVEEVAVIGMPDKELGERICAYVRAKPGSRPLKFEEVICFLKGKGASVLQLPERVEFVDTIPLTKAGKPDKRALREDIRKRMGLD